jgi:TRAP-type mannitol/chloroaromatic compound transport system substrate-binding protein
MTKGKRIKYLLFVCLALALTSLLACGPAAPSNGEGDCSDVEADLAASEKKVSDLEDDLDAKDDEIKDLEDDLAALQKPAKVYRWEPAVWINAGTPWDYLVYFSEYMNEMSDGRVVSTPSAVGAVAPAEELMEAVSDGTTQCMLPTPSYYAGKFPMAAVYNTSIGLPSALDMMIAYEVFEGGRASELYYNAAESLYNVKVAGQRIGPVEAIISSNIPIRSLADLEGMKFRCGDDHFAGPFNALGASTVWAPGSEIYTMLATGVVDAFTYGSCYDHYGMSFHEVTDYWHKSSIMAANNEQLVINIDIWNEMGDDLKAMVDAASYAANMRTITEAYPIFNETWAAVEAYGVEVIEWAPEDVSGWVAAQMEWLKQYEDDPDVAEFNGIIARYDESIGL